jgi:hypothetical protein
MDFFINKGSNYPELIMEVIKDNHNDYEDFYVSLMETATSIQFKMTDIDTGMIKVPYKPAKCVTLNDGEIGIGYKFESKDVDRQGTYIGQFIITFENSDRLIVPYRDELKIHVTNSGIRV